MAGTILIVEDSPSVRRLIEVCLRPLQMRVLMAEDGVSGLELVEAERPDVILLDIGLPGIDGWEVLRRLRAHDEVGATYVIIVTAHAQPEVAAEAERSGADGFVTKPFRPEDLRDAITDVLEGRSGYSASA